MGLGAVVPPPPSLYGITHSNRGGDDLWGKNQFNSTFPTALACYMRDKHIPAVYLTLRDDLTVAASEITIDELFNTDRPNDQLRFDFENLFAPYRTMLSTRSAEIDPVVKNESDAEPSSIQ
jgi:hypothetical protein